MSRSAEYGTLFQAHNVSDQKATFADATSSGSNVMADQGITRMVSDHDVIRTLRSYDSRVYNSYSIMSLQRYPPGRAARCNLPTATDSVSGRDAFSHTVTDHSRVHHVPLHAQHEIAPFADPDARR